MNDANLLRTILALVLEGVEVAFFPSMRTAFNATLPASHLARPLNDGAIERNSLGSHSELETNVLGIGFGVAHNCIAAGILQRNLCSSYEHHMGSVCVCKFTLVKELVTDKHKLWRIFFRALWNRGAKRIKYLNRWIVVDDI